MNLLDNTIIGDAKAREERLVQARRLAYRFRRSKLSLAGLFIILSVIVVAIFAPQLAPYPEDRTTSHFEVGPQPPSLAHPFGTDTVGRDLLSRVMFGARISVSAGLFTISLTLVVGVTLGLIAGYSEGWVNTVIMRVVDVFLSVPPLILAIAVIAVVGQSLVNALLAIVISWWPWYARLVHGEVLSVKEEQYIEASRSIGTGWVRILYREVLPNVVTPLTVKATLDMGTALLIVASISFLGLGAQPPTPSWGVIIAQGRQFIGSHWWISTFSGLAISYTVLGFNLLGDGLRDILDVEIQ